MTTVPAPGSHLLVTVIGLGLLCGDEAVVEGDRVVLRRAGGVRTVIVARSSSEAERLLSEAERDVEDALA